MVLCTALNNNYTTCRNIIYIKREEDGSILIAYKYDVNEGTQLFRIKNNIIVEPLYDIYEIVLRQLQTTSNLIDLRKYGFKIYRLEGEYETEIL